MAVIDSGTGSDSQDTLKFSVLAGMRSLSEVFPLERVAAAFERMMSGKARFRVVLNSGQQPFRFELAALILLRLLAVRHAEFGPEGWPEAGGVNADRDQVDGDA